MYCEGHDVFLQNHLLFLDQIDGVFDPSQPYAHIPSRETVSEDGEPISEWKITLDDLMLFLEGV